MSRSAIELWAWGKHPVVEAMHSRFCRVHEIFHAEQGRAMPTYLEEARKKNIALRATSRDAISKKCGTDKHQDVAARVSLDAYDSFSDWWETIPEKGTTTLLALDGLEDPQNFGTLLRSAHFFGAGACLVTRDRAAPVTGVVAKASAGALFSLPMIRCVNLARELESCAEQAFWIVGLDAEAKEPLRKLAIGDKHLVLVIGSEGEGLRELTKKRCDELRALPGSGRDSLNAAVAGSIALYEAAAQRRL